jgi:hypothetical protein
MAQYHTQWIDGKKWRWDVPYLWKLSRNIKPKRIKISKLAKTNFTEGCWFSKCPTFQDVLDHMQRVMKANLRYAILLDPKGQIMDGYHRVAKAKILKKKTILIKQFENLPPPTKIYRKRQ